MLKNPKSSLFFVWFAVLIGWLSSCSMKSAEELAEEKSGSGFITDKRINEASGIAVSRINEDVIWLHNDSKSSAHLYAVNQYGKFLASVKVRGVKNVDWEDLAAFEYHGEPYLVIGDVGDNYSERKYYQLHFVKEPDISVRPVLRPKFVKPDWTLTFTYPDGAKDSESIAVDVLNQRIVLLSKREERPIVYELPLKAEGIQIAKRLGDIAALPEPENLKFSLIDLLGYGQMPTAMDISSDSKSLIVLTYTSAYLFHVQPGQSWLEVLSSEPEEIELPELEQAEAIGFTKDGTSIFVTSEKIPAPFLKIEL